VTDLGGDPYGLHSPLIIASNGLIHGEIAAILSTTDPLDTL
jgi:hypothetical protein